MRIQPVVRISLASLVLMGILGLLYLTSQSGMQGTRSKPCVSARGCDYFSKEFLRNGTNGVMSYIESATRQSAHTEDEGDDPLGSQFLMRPTAEAPTVMSFPVTSQKRTNQAGQRGRAKLHNTRHISVASSQENTTPGRTSQPANPKPGGTSNCSVLLADDRLVRNCVTNDVIGGVPPGVRTRRYQVEDAEDVFKEQKREGREERWRSFRDIYFNKTWGHSWGGDPSPSGIDASGRDNLRYPAFSNVKAGFSFVPDKILSILHVLADLEKNSPFAIGPNPNSGTHLDFSYILSNRTISSVDLTEGSPWQ